MTVSSLRADNESGFRQKLNRTFAQLKRKHINLALQGAGSHGALTWGVIEALLADGRLHISAISGTSAGAVNAVALAAGLMEGGRDGALAKLESVWQKVSRLGGNSPFRMPSFFALPGTAPREEKMNHLSLDLMSRMFSPAVLNPLDIDPLRGLLEAEIDFEGLRRHSPVKLFIAATDIANGRARLFSEHEISADCVLASACLPHLSRAVEIDGHHYWDGGYSANPALVPLIRKTRSDDTLLVQLNAIPDDRVPVTAREIIGRANLLAFSQPLAQEISLITEQKQLLRQTGLQLSKDARRFKKHRFHLIDGSPITRDLSQASKFYTDWPHLCELRDKGSEIAKQWLTTQYRHIGHRATVDLAERY